MAKKTRKERAKSTRHREYAGGKGTPFSVPYYEVQIKGKWVGRWRVDKRHKDIPKPNQRRYFNSKEDAKAYAYELHERLIAIDQGKLMPESALGENTVEYITAQKNIIKFNNRNTGCPLPSDCKDLTASKAVDVATQFLDAVVSVNRYRESGQKDLWDVATAITYLRDNAIKEARRVNVPLGKHIDTFLKWKLGPTGSKHGNRELEKDSKDEWNYHLGLLKKWGGKDITRSGKEGKKTLKKVQRKISTHVYRDGSGKLWADQTRKRCAEKVKQFGMWLVKEDIVKNNPFEHITDGYRIITRKSKEYYTVKEVEEIFVNALKGDDAREVLKQYIMTFFSTLRPSEIAKEASTRRLQWEQIKWDGEDNFPIKGTVAIWMPKWTDGKRTSKTNDRWAMLWPVGATWLKWYIKEYHDGKPIKEFFYHRKALDRHRDSLSFEIGSDWPRHTSISMALKHFTTVPALQEQLSRRYGHSVDVQSGVYDAPLSTANAKKFFEMTPQKLIKKHRIKLKR